MCMCPCLLRGVLFGDLASIVNLRLVDKRNGKTTWMFYFNDTLVFLWYKSTVYDSYSQDEKAKTILSNAL